MRSNRKYDSEFKREAVLLVVEQGLTIREAESNLGITHGVLKGWVQKHRDSQSAPPVAPGQLSPEAENKLLRKENERLRREREILKKAVAIFSVDPDRYSGS